MGRVVRKTRNAASAVGGFVLAYAVLMGIVIAVSVSYYGEIDLFSLVVFAVLIAAVLGHYAWKQYRWLNSVDGIGPNVPPP